MEKEGEVSRFCFYQKVEHAEYNLCLHRILFENGYCKENIPQNIAELIKVVNYFIIVDLEFILLVH